MDHQIERVQQFYKMATADYSDVLSVEFNALEVELLLAKARESRRTPVNEHGLKSLVYAGQVLCIGTDEVDEMESCPSDKRFTKAWNRSVMTPAEIAAYEAYRDADYE